MTDTAMLKTEFERLGPWVTCYRVGGEVYGGAFDAMNDPRVLTEFAQAFPQARTVLELGSLEGGHSFALAGLPHVERVVAIESRDPNLARARFMQQVLDISKVEFVQANLEAADLSQWGQFEAVFCSGLLYHLPEPWLLLERLRKVSPNLYMSTHYAVPSDQLVTRNGYQGKIYQEYGVADPLSGMSDHSFWPTLAELQRMLKDSGYATVDIISNNAEHPNGGIISLKAFDV